MKPRTSKIIRLGIGIGLLLIIVQSIDLGNIAVNFSSLDVVSVILLSMTVVFRRSLMAFKWNILLRARGIIISFGQAIRIYFIGYLLGTVTPGGIGAEAFRIAALTSFNKTGVVISTIILERLIGLAVICVVAIINIPFVERYFEVVTPGVAWTIFSIGALAVCVLFVSLNRNIIRKLTVGPAWLRENKVAAKLKSFYDTYVEFRNYTLALIQFAFLTLIELLAMVTLVYLATRSFGFTIPFYYFLGTMPFVFILLRIPITLDGIGVQEGLLAFVFVHQGYSVADGVSVSILLRLVAILFGHMPAVIMILLKPLQVKPLQNSAKG